MPSSAAVLAMLCASGAFAAPPMPDVATALDATVWDTSNILSDTSLFGRVLHALMGYSDQPSGMQLVVYLITLAVILSLTKLFASPLPTKRSAAIP